MDVGLKIMALKYKKDLKTGAFFRGGKRKR